MTQNDNHISPETALDKVPRHVAVIMDGNGRKAGAKNACSDTGTAWTPCAKSSKPRPKRASAI